MAVTITTNFTGKFDRMRCRNVNLSFSSTDTSKAVPAGIGYTVPIGGYTDFTLSGETFTMVVVGNTSQYANVLFLGC